MAVTLEHGGDDRPPNTQMDSVETYAQEAALRSEMDVLEGLRELEGAEGVKWFIYRINAPDPSQNGFLDRWGTALLTQENLRDKFGPGTYKVRGHYPNGTYAAHRTIEIAGDAPRRDQTASGRNLKEGGAMDVTQLLVMLDQRDERRRAEEAAKRDENQSFWKSLAATLAPIVAPKILDMVTGGNKQGTVPELLAGLKELRALDQPATGRNSVKEMLETFALMKDAFDGGSRVGEKGPWDALTELAKGAGPKLGAVLEALPNALNGSKPNLPMSGPLAMRAISSSRPNSVRVDTPNPLPVAVMDSPSASDAGDESETPRSTNSVDGNTNSPEAIPSPISETNPIPTNGEEGDMNLALVSLLPYLRKQMELLVIKAARNSDPGLYAELLLDNLPDGVNPKTLLAFIQRDDWWTVLQEFDARVEPYAGWFTNFRNDLIDAIENS